MSISSLKFVSQPYRFKDYNEICLLLLPWFQSGDKEPSGMIDLRTVTTLEMHAVDDTRTLDIGTADK